MPTFILSLLNSPLRTQIICRVKSECDMVLPPPKTFSRYKNVHLLLHWSLGHCDIINPEIKNRCGDNSYLESSTDTQ